MNAYLLLSTLNLSLGGLVFLLGLVILRENAGQRLNRIVAMMLFFGGFGAVLAGLAFMAARPLGVASAKTATPDLLQSVSYIWEFFFPTLFLFACIFPEERPFVRRFRSLPRWVPGFAILVFAPHVFHFLIVLMASAWRPELSVEHVGALRMFQPVIGIVNVLLRLFLLVHQTLFSLVNLGFGLATMLLLFGSYRRARVPRLRQQLRVIAIGLSACLVCYSLASSIPTLLNLRLPEGVRSGLIIAALTLGPGSIVYSIVRYKFLDTKLLARRGILYALASALLVGLYLLVVENRLLPMLSAATGANRQVFEPVFLIMALALFQPAMARLEELLDRMFLKDPGDYRNVLRQLGRELQTTIDLEELLSRTVRTLAESLLLRTAHIVVLSGRQAFAHTGAGPTLGPQALERLAGLLPRISSRQSSWRVDEEIEGLTAEDEEALAALGLSVVVPMHWRGDLVGALLLGDKLTGTPITSEDVSLLTSLASQVSVSLQNALLLRDRVAVARFEEELNLARQIQQTSLLSEFPALPRCEVHAVYAPSKHVGGDFYDVVPTGDGGYLIAIADVSGKGVPAALLSAMLQASLRTQAGTIRSLGAILANINALLYRSTGTHQFATFFLGRIEGDGMRLTFSNAGHNYPVLVRPGGERVLLERGGTILGILEDIAFEEDTVALSAGDVVVLYTDGVSEAMNAAGELFGEDRLCTFLSALPHGLPSRVVAERLVARLHEFLGEVEPQDDVTLLILRVLEPVASPIPEVRAPEVVAAG